MDLFRRYKRIVCVSLPGWRVVDTGLVAPGRPALARSPREEFKIRPWAAIFDNLILLIRLARMLALARRQQIHLPPSGRERARLLAAHAEQDQLGHVAEIEPDPASVRASVLAYLVPDDVG